MPRPSPPRLIVLISISFLIALALAGLLWNGAPPRAMRQGDVTPQVGAADSGIRAVVADSEQQQFAQVHEAYGKLPMSFETNDGQTDPRVRFISRGSGYTLFLTPSEAVLSLRAPLSRAQRATAASDDTHVSRHQTRGENSKSAVLRMSFAGANPRAAVAGLEEQSSKTNYFVGRDPSKWRTNVFNFSRVRYTQIYPGVDLEYYGNQRQLEYDFRIAAGASVDTIRLAYRGTKGVRVEEASGDLVLETAGGELRQPKPFVYQEMDGRRKELDGRYVLQGRGVIGFEVAGYDHTQALIIDPVLSYSTFLGGTNAETGRSIALDSFGNAYVTGFTNSTTFPTQNPLQPTNGGQSDAFVTKLNATGTALIYSTYLGGSGIDEGSGIAVDATGNAYITGDTSSSNFPVQGAFQAALGGTQDAFALKLNPTGSALVYSTYLGGSGADSGSAVALDAASNAYITGDTSSTNFPLQTPLQPASGGSSDAFVTKLNATGSALTYSTYLGGAGSDAGNDIVLDALGNAYVTGTTSSNNFPVQGAFQPATGGGSSDAFVTKLNAAGSAFVYSTYLGGSGSEFGEGIALDASGNAYVAGSTGSTNFPVQNPFQATNASGVGVSDAFVTKFNATGTALVYSTYLGGSAQEDGTDIAVDSHGNAYIVGETLSPNFPVQDAFQATPPGGDNAFVSKLNTTGSGLVYSTYLDGNTSSQATGIALDTLGNAYVTGQTTSNNFPVTTGAFQTTFQGAGDVFVTRLSQSGSCNAPTYAASTGSPFAAGGSPVSVAVGDFNNDGKQDFATANTTTDTAAIFLGDGAGGFAAPTSFGVGDQPFAIAVGDFNSDGKQDLVTANTGPAANSVSVLLGTGTGSFAAATTFSVGTAPHSLAVGDFNGDGKQDLAVANRNSDNVSILLGNGAGGFGAATNFAVGSRPESIAVGDFNSDGKQDLVTANLFSNDVSVLLGNGAGSFSAATNFGAGTNARSVAVGDFNGDGKQDLATANEGADSVSILLGNGAGSFAAATTFNVGTAPRGIALSDFNSDSKEDIAVTNQGTNDVSVLLGNGAGSFSAATNFAVGDTPSSVAVGDFNGDGKPDLAAANNNSSDVSVLLSSCGLPTSNTVVVTNTNDSGAGSLRQAILDANATVGVKETIVFDIAGAGVHTIQPASALPTVTDPVIIDGYTQPGASPNTLAVGDDAVLLIELEGENAGMSGLTITAGSSIVRGLVINRFGSNEIDLQTNGNNVVEGCFIGTNTTGTTDLNTGSDGIFVSTANNRVGGTNPAQRNIISGNDTFGIEITGSGATGNQVKGNYIGTNAAGTADLGNGSNGIHIFAAPNNIVGGATVADRNVISGNDGSGVFIGNNTATGNIVRGNFIGTDASGASALGNTGNGVVINAASANNIGGTTAVEGNRIAFNGVGGVVVEASATNNAILGNATFQNGGLGIDLNSNGVTANDANDADTGPNNLQNFPVLTAATSSGGNTTIVGTLNSTASTAYRVEFFSNATCDASGNGEGRTFLGFANVTTDGAGNATINTTLGATTTVGEVVTATATDPAGNTSEFSQCFTVTAPPSPTLGNYPDATAQLGGNTTVSPSASPANTAHINVSTSTNFKGKLEGDPETGIVRVTDAHPAGVYTLTVTALNGSGLTTQKTFVLSVTTPATCSPVSFASAASFGTGTQPVSVAIGDFNGDGKQDLAFADASGGFGAGEVGVVLGNGAGGFGTFTSFNVGTTPLSVAVGDFNGDGKQDLAAANGNSNNISVLLGNGTGSFSAATNFAVGTAPLSVAVGDFNGDGKQDLAVANRDSNNVSVLLGDGTGGFGSAVNFGVGTQPQSVAVGDFNSDGKQDIAAGNFNSNNVSVLLGDGAGGFAAATNFGVGTTPLSVAVGDFNGDGKQDLATANLGSANVSILLGNGTGSFSAAVNFGTGTQPASVAVGDFDGDGRQDLTTANFNSNNVSVLIGDGTGSFSAAINFVVAANPRSVAVGDFNGDGKQDIVTANQFADNVSILLRQCPPPPTFNWNGSVSADWHTAGNWSGGVVPTATDDAVIPSAGVTNEPTISSANAVANSVTVQTGRTLTISNRTLTATTLAVNTGATLHIPSNQTGNVNAAVTNDGTFDGVNANSLVMFVGTSFTNNGTVSVGFFRFGGTTQTLSGTGSFTSANIEIISGATVTLASNHTLSTLTVSDGTFDQGASFNLTVGPVVISSIGTWRNLGTGDLTLAGDFSNAGTAQFNGGGAACGDADSILIRSSVAGTQRAWTGGGTYSLIDVDVKDQAGTSAIAVRSGTDSGNNGANWSFVGCAGGATTFTVNSANDADDGTCDSAHCSLREAINASNANIGTDTIVFNIAGVGVHTISPASALPLINDPVNVDGYTQPGSSVNTSPNSDNAVLKIELDGTNAGAGTTGLTFNADGSTVRGLIINRFKGNGIQSLSRSNNVVTGNFIGTNAAGTAALGNSLDGILWHFAPNNTIGGTAAGERNIISGNAQNGIEVVGAPAGGNQIQGNFIGTDATGTAALGNVGNGIVFSDAPNSTIGGATAGARNIISGNNSSGIFLISSGPALNLSIGGNFIGTDASGTADLGNALDGVTFDSASNNHLGSTIAAERNVISGNNRNGVFMLNGGNNNVVTGNFIGTNAAGNSAIGNSSDGVRIDSSSNNIVGGAAAGAGNLVEGNVGAGVSVISGTGNAIVANQIFNNGALGIDLGANGVTTNDGAGDPDTGANDLQNFPFLPSAASNGVSNSTTVTTLFVSKTNSAFTLHFYSSPSCDPSGNGEGETFLGSVNANTNNNGTDTPSATFPVALPTGSVVTATATDAAGNTSEFSPCRTVTAQTFSLSGRVNDQMGQGMLGINIHLSGSATADTTTDASGNYTFTGLPQGGSFTITPFETNFRFDPASRAVNNLQANQTGLDFTGRLVNHIINGTIVDSQGHGLPGVTVTLAGALSFVTFTDAQGNFTFHDVPTNGSFTVTPEKEGFTFNPARREITDIDADATFGSTGTAQPVPTPTPDQSDDFSGGPAPDPDKWSIGILTNPPPSFDPRVNVFLGGGLLHIKPRSDANGPSYSGLISVRALDLNSTPIISVEAVQAAVGVGAQTIFGLGTNDDNWFRFAVQDSTTITSSTLSANIKTQSLTFAKRDAGLEDANTGQTLLFEINVGGRKFSTGIAYDPSLHRFWRFRHDAPARLIIFETSPDAVNWTERFRAQLPADQTSLIAELSAGTFRPTANSTEALFDNFLLSPSPHMQFTASAFNARESDAAAHVQVIRTGSDESPVAVDFATSDGTAHAGSDYTPVHVTLTFGIGERLKVVDIPLINDDAREETETVNVSLSNPVGGRLGSIPLAVLSILDDDNQTSANPIDQTGFFVRQHYLDFLGREADAQGLAFWTNNIESCGANAACRDAKRVDTSAAFFLSIEFQQTGFVVHRFYRASFARPPKFTEYLPDLTIVREGVVVGEPGALERLELNQRLFAEQWTNRTTFKQVYGQLNEMQYVDALTANAGITLVEEERTALIVGLLTRRETRASVLLKIVENEDFARREFNPAFVRMEYFGYLRRDPDDAGFQFWLAKLERFGGDFHKAEMVRAFLSSTEYRARFGQP
ncbi:MAG: hypothetical protein QOJ70_1225 [Acidobacteriota bacterium]|jgi:CSLREA domain-containing protein|nr:hypothetical protein [Acidobacteriota bacterium]